MHPPELRFLGATGTVTGSRTLLRAGNKAWLVDCGLFQGFKQLRLRNWEPFPVDPKTLSGVVFTHAHIDHTGYLPRLVREGFRGPVYCTPATADLAGILLRDSAYLMEEDARFANKHGFSKHRPARPLYNVQEADEALRLLQPVPWDRNVELGSGASFRFLPAGHILGAAIVEWDVAGRRIVFTGDLGRPHDPLMRPPVPLPRTDFLVLEATYGNRLHDPRDPRETLAEAMRATLERDGVVLVPAFAVARAQVLLHLLVEMRKRRMIPKVPVVLNSPMASAVTELYHKYRHEHRLTDEECDAMCSLPRYVRSEAESKALNDEEGPMVIVSASGMATGGRVLHHLKRLAPDPKNTILFVGYQAGGTRGASMLNGEPSVKIHGTYVPVRAQVRVVDNLSAHADWKELVAWFRSAPQAPRTTWLNHGEPEAAAALRHRLLEATSANVEVPGQLDEVSLR
ncbi:MAG: MBL fold metallo-hydrolase [Euryarchaeota archaeon]|nr:MBL fold metallo-hydrolase [Euryarchaeota archaeon]